VQRGYQRARDQAAEDQGMYMKVGMDQVEGSAGGGLHGPGDVKLLGQPLRSLQGLVTGFDQVR
jgi:hypothetical protein